MNKQELQEVLAEIFEDEIYDICDEIKQDAIISSVTTVALNLSKGMRTIVFMLGGYQFKVINRVGGSVSCSHHDYTTVSDTLYKPFPNDGEHDLKECCKNLVEMMNEAWYAWNN